MSILRQWIKRYDQEHKCLFSQSETEPSTMPTRLIDLGTMSGPRLRLVETGRRPKLEYYIALSRRWGQVDSRKDPCTYRSNIEQRKQNIDIDELPRSFQDAIAVSRALGVQYLWIDSLCIIQKDMEDWELEAGNMEAVFSSAYCTIAATSAKSSHVGFLGPLKPRSVVTVPSRTGPLYICQNIDNFHEDVEKGVLNTRGWVLQERALSRRTIHFTATQIYLECGQGIYCETLAKLSK
jgi:hypothetical protein